MEEYIERKPLTAFVLSFLTQGLGQLYNGQLRKAILFYLLAWLTMIFCSFYGLYFSFNGLVVSLVIGVAYTFFVMIEAAISARRLHIIKAKKYNKWYFYLLIILITTFLTNSLLKPFVFPVKFYRLPTDSMAPTLLCRDRVVVHKYYYATQDPKRGDIVIFTIPQEANEDSLMRVIRLSGDAIGRVIGLPGETIEMEDKKVLINGEPLEEPYIMSLPIIVLPPAIAALEKFGPVTVPDGKLFVLGDNRKHSIDSRHFGFVDIATLKGKSLYVFLAKDKKRIGNTIK